MGKWTTKLNRQIVSSPQLRSLQWILHPLHWGTWAKLGGGHTSWAAPSAHHDGLALPVPSVLRNSHLPHAYVLKGFLTCKDFLALRKVLLAQSHNLQSQWPVVFGCPEVGLMWNEAAIWAIRSINTMNYSAFQRSGPYLHWDVAISLHSICLSLKIPSWQQQILGRR